MSEPRSEKGLPAIRPESVDDGWLGMDTAGLPDGDFLAVAAVPCPAGRMARGGVGGQMITSCSLCGHVSPSTATQRHDGPMLVLVVARKSTDGLAFRRADLRDCADEGADIGRSGGPND